MNGLASRYAKTVFQLAKTEESLKKYRKELECFGNILEKKPTIFLFFNSPQIPQKEKMAVLEKTMAKEFSPEIILFLKLLLKNRRFSNLSEIIHEFTRLVHEKLGIATAFLKSALPLNEEQKNGMIEKLEQFSGKQIELEEEVDPKLLGGGVLTMNHHFIDFSLKGKLTRLSDDLLRK